ncbi:MAG: hypothetical protein K6U11_01940 [bacterium]|nr:hypothetical protein [bacterium]
MKLRTTLLIIFFSIILLSLSSPAKAQMVSFSGQAGLSMISPFLSSFFPQRAPFISSAFYTPSLMLPLPSLAPVLRPSPLAPIPVPMSIPRPMVRNAAATITIIFNPAVSVVNVSAVPITAIAPATAVPTTTLPTTTTPTIAPTALALLLPALVASTAPAAPPYTQTQTLVTPAAAAPGTAPAAAAAKVAPAATSLTTTTTLPGLTALLPLLI